LPIKTPTKKKIFFELRITYPDDAKFLSFFLGVNFLEKRKIKIWVEEICIPYYFFSEANA
jgi:hypothetical protein